MSVPVHCNGCGADLHAKDAFIGKQLNCPRCGADLGVIEPQAYVEMGSDFAAAALPPAASASRRPGKKKAFLRTWLIVGAVVLLVGGLGVWTFAFPSSEEDQLYQDLLAKEEALMQRHLA